MPSKKRKGLSKREFNAKKFEAAKKKAFPVYKSGMVNGQPRNYYSPKMMKKGGIITSLD